MMITFQSYAEASIRRAASLPAPHRFPPSTLYLNSLCVETGDAIVSAIRRIGYDYSDLMAVDMTQSGSCIEDMRRILDAMSVLIFSKSCASSKYDPARDIDETFAVCATFYFR